ncbi:CHAT domain-containing protein [Actinoplanes subglobosus]|uniref:CHAT domain-containing protein n=1 Tax=Actinoplanes subglobosus TaxID=1547892 RepID=A0ABV8INJ2_9ACTN
MTAADDTFAAMLGTGLHLLDRGDQVGARRWFAQAARSDDPALLTDLGAIYQESLGDPGRAETCYRRAATAGNTDAMNRLGVLLKQRDELTEAETWLLRAAEGGDAHALNNLGGVYERRGDNNRAIEYFRAALERGVLAAFYPLVMKLWAAGRHDEALGWYRQGERWDAPEIRPQLEFLASLLEHGPPAGRPGAPQARANRGVPPITVDVDDPLGSAERARGVFLLTDDPVPLDLARDLAAFSAEHARRGGDDRARALSLLGDLERLRFERDGDEARLEAAVRFARTAYREVLPTDPSYPLVLSRLASGLVALAEHTGETEPLREARALHEEAIGELAPGDPRFAELWTGHGNALLAAEWEDDAVLALRAAVEATPAGDPERIVRQVHLAFALVPRFERGGVMAARDEARALLDRARAELPPAHRLRGSVDAALDLLAGSGTPAPATAEQALDEYRRTGELDLLRHGIELLRAGPVGGETRRRLGVALTLLYRRLGDPATLDEAIELLDADSSALVEAAEALRLRARRTGGEDLRRALALARTAVRQTSAEDAERATRLRALAAIVVEVGTATQDSLAVREGVDLFRAALAETPPDSPDRPAAAVALGTALLAAARHDPALLDEAVRLTTGAVTAVGTGHPERAAFETAAAQALHQHALHTGDADTADRATMVARSAVSATPEDHPDRPERLGVLCRILLHDADLDEAIREAEAWTAATPDWHPRWGEARTTLARLLAARAIGGADPAELLAAVVGLRAVATNARIAATERVLAADLWATVCGLLGDPTQREAYALALDLLPRTARRGLPRADREEHLGLFAGLASRAAARALADGDTGLALRWLEQGRGVLLDQALGVRTELAALHEREPGLAEEFAALIETLDPDPDLLADPAESAHRREDLDRRLDEVVAEIRRQPGLDGFLSPPTEAELRERCADRLVAVLNVSDARCDAILLGRGDPVVVPLPDLRLAEVREAAAGFRGAIRAVQRGTIAERLAGQRLVTAVLAWLWEAAARPVLDAAGVTGQEPHRPRIWWVPTGPLVELPLHAAGRHDDDGPTVLDRVVSSYLPTIRSLTPPRQPDTGDKPSVLVVAMPRTPGAADLPHVDAEVEALRALTPVTVLAGEHATREAVLPALGNHAWAHFACHVSGEPERGTDIRLLLHDHEHRPVSLADIVRLRPASAEFAYLSACDTARAPTHLADEAVHVAGAFQMAGYGQVVATMWPVGDQAAAEITADVYPLLLAGATAAESLDAAVRRQRDRYPAAPTRWASHVHVGA